MIFPLSVLAYLLIFRISFSHFTYTYTHTHIYIQFYFAHFCGLNSCFVPPSLHIIHMSLSVLQMTPLFLSVPISLCLSVCVSFSLPPPHTNIHTYIYIKTYLVSAYERNMVFVVLPIFSSSLLCVCFFLRPLRINYTGIVSFLGVFSLLFRLDCFFQLCRADLADINSLNLFLS